MAESPESLAPPLSRPDIAFQVGPRQVAAAEVVPLLAGYQLLTPLLRELAIDAALDSFPCPEAESLTCLQTFYQQQGIKTTAEQHQWLAQRHLTSDQLLGLATRAWRVARLKEQTFAPRLESHFLKRKAQLDRAVYSLIRTPSGEIAQELYFRIQEGEQSFAELARAYSQGPEARTGGLVGPVPMGNLNATLAKILTTSQPRQVWPPVKLDTWFVIVRLEERLPVTLDEGLRQQLLDELFEQWLQEQVHALSTALTVPSPP
ncbi:MAG: peptidylprolyl isomerase [Gloeomargaritaceae cyanobacterium C42_A2020_066]|nr:peptidylprolyl isomerase [Gloeomargaritaceae cyanobacterium C42_A2020_066]